MNQWQLLDKGGQRDRWWSFFGWFENVAFSSYLTSVRRKDLSESHVTTPSHRRLVRLFSASHLPLLFSRPVASCLPLMLKISLIEISRFCGWGLERNTESSTCIKSHQQIKHGGWGVGGAVSLSLSFSIFERTEGVGGTVSWLLIPLFPLLSHAVKQSGHCVQQLFHSGLTFQDLVGTPCSLILLFCLPAGTADTSPHHIRLMHARRHAWKTLLLFFLRNSRLLEIQWQIFLNIHTRRNFSNYSWCWIKNIPVRCTLIQRFKKVKCPHCWPFTWPTVAFV